MHLSFLGDMEPSRRQELRSLVHEQERMLRDLRSGVRRLSRQLKSLTDQRRVSFSTWTLIRIAEALDPDPAPNQLIETHLLQGRFGKRARRHDHEEGISALPAAVSADVVHAARAELIAPVQSRLAFRAAKLVAEARLVLRINTANERGASPRAAEIVSWLGEEWPHSERRGRYAAFVAKVRHSKHRKNFLMKFRRRWHIRLRLMPCRSSVPPEEQSQKVFRFGMTFFFGIRGPISEPLLTPTSGGHFLTPRSGYPMCWATTGGPISGAGK